MKGYLEKCNSNAKKVVFKKKTKPKKMTYSEQFSLYLSAW